MARRIDILHDLFEKNPYEGFDPGDLALDVQTWGGDNPIFERLIDLSSPSLIIEVGSWKGGSAIHMGSYIREKKLDCKILCVDTWLGSIEHWDKRAESSKLHFWYASLRLKNGYPQLYYQFLFNVIHHGLQDIIIPFPNTSLIASRWLRYKGVFAELIYIDGSHDEQDVYDDLRHYFPLLRNNGIIFGDDWEWPSVQNAIRRFARESGMRVKVMVADSIWLFQKSD